MNRGGGWNSNARNCRASNRNNNPPGIRNDNLGFRLVSTGHPFAGGPGSTDPARVHRPCPDARPAPGTARPKRTRPPALVGSGFRDRKTGRPLCRGCLRNDRGGRARSLRSMLSRGNHSAQSGDLRIQRGARYEIAWGEAAEPQVSPPPKIQPRRGGIRQVEHVREGYVAPPGLKDSGPTALGFAKPHPRLSHAALRAGSLIMPSPGCAGRVPETRAFGPASRPFSSRCA